MHVCICICMCVCAYVWIDKRVYVCECVHKLTPEFLNVLAVKGLLFPWLLFANFTIDADVGRGGFITTILCVYEDIVLTQT